MKNPSLPIRPRQFLTYIAVLVNAALFLQGCKQKTEIASVQIHKMDPAQTARISKSIESGVTPQLAAGLSLHLWGIDSLIADPIAIDIDDAGRLYYTRTNRQKHSEFDIRGHQEWEIESIHLQTVEERRAFLHKILSPENSKTNEWLEDLNRDGSHDWRDLTVEREQIFRIEDTSGDGVADQSQLVVEDFHDEVTDVAGGVLVEGNDLFVAVAPDVWKLNDTNGDGTADKKESISHGYGIHIGFGGHGMSGLEMGPDGKIYWQIGDIGFNGTGPEGQKWEHPNSGVVVRANPDGSDFEVFAYGVRNTHEFVFDEYGNLISEDNDGDHPGEKERIVYIVNGADVGWRSNWQYGKYRDPDNNTYKVWMDEKMHLPKFEGQAAYFVPTLANYVSGPAGMVYNPGTAMGPAWKNTFFIAEFVGNPARSGIHAFKLTPKGASFELGDHRSILSGVLATGIDFGPDGALYIADWIDGWDAKNYGRIWKLDENGASESPERKQTKTLLAADFSSYDERQLGEILSNPDMRVRLKAQFELVKRGPKGLEIFKNTLAGDRGFAGIHSIWGISQFIRKESTHGSLLMPLLHDKDTEFKAQAAKWLGDVRFKEAGVALVPLLDDANSRVRFFAAEALGRIAYETAINPLIELLRANNDDDVYLRHAASLALARIGKAEPLIALTKDPSRAVRVGAVVALRRMRSPGIAVFLNDTDEYVVTEAARGINDDLSIEEALPALGDVLGNSRFGNEALIRRAISANLRTGTGKAMQNLIDFAGREGNPVAMRVEAIDALSTWPKPSVLDRVDGRYRGVVSRDPLPLRNNVSDVFTRLLNQKELPIRRSSARAIGKLKIAGAANALFASLNHDPEASQRIEALRSLALMEDEHMADAIQKALSDKDKEVRIAGLDLLAKSAMPKPLMVSLLSEAIQKRTPEEKQAALITLGNLPIEHSQPVFNRLLDAMAKGALPEEIHLELEEAIDSTRAAPLIARYKEINARRSPDSLLVVYGGSLVGGDSKLGQRTFYQNQTAQCIRCHSLDDYGGNAGPRLNGVAGRLTRPQLLEALITPSARLADGFGMVTLELKSGKRVRGILQKERKDGLTLKVGDKPDTVVRNEDIRKRTNDPSSMPPMRFLLTKREIRDLVSFLSTLK